MINTATITAPSALDLRVQRPAGASTFNLTAYRGGDQVAELTRTVNTPGEAFATAQQFTDAAAIAAGPCPAWCVTGPHEAYPTDHLDDGSRQHSGNEVRLTVPGSMTTQPVSLDIQPTWIQGGAEPALVYTTISEAGQTVAELLMDADQAEALAAQLVATAAQLRASVVTAAAAR
ncbi:DUF6907 domain-containing protein [Actinoplanes sp. NPDC051494]|uniref:DUF6907 domain-containing protein n=1 Tax=Actinoplanes sp. NPDC051494 TaxID=3363907 RepID=UPI0037A96967